MRIHRLRPQQTIRQAAEVTGVGFLTGATVRLRFLPAPPDTGVIFIRTDLSPRAWVPARFEGVTGTQRRTTLGQPPLHVGLVEHVLAALAGLRVDNCRIELDAAEPPGMDGSAQAFVDALLQVGIISQNAQRPVWQVTEPVLVSQEGVALAFHPGTEDELKISYLLDYGPGSPIARQCRTQVVSPAAFASELAGSRTFLLEAEAQELRQRGLGPRTTPADLLVFGPDGPINNQLRNVDEPARHKILDLVGDLSLLGEDVRGHILAHRSGHPLNVELVRGLARRLGKLSGSQVVAQKRRAA